MFVQNPFTQSRKSTLTERQRRILTFLKSQHTGVLSTVTPDCDPHGAVIYYDIDDNFTVSFLTKKDTRKLDNLNHNNHAMLTVYEPRSQAIVQVLGVATEHPSGADVTEVSNRVFKRMMRARDNELPPIVKLQAGSFTTFAIKPVQIRMAVYSRPDAGDYSRIFESIESFELESN